MRTEGANVERTRNGARTSAAIRSAAADLFYEHGYEATSLRSVADRVGIKVGSLYNHLDSKDELLVDIMSSVLDRLGPLLDQVADAAGQNPVDRFKAAVGEHIRFHAQHAQETFIGNSELRALRPEQREVVLQGRRAYDLRIRSLIKEAADEVGVEVVDLRLQSYAILALGMHVASWFRERPDISLSHVVEVYTELTCRQVGIPSSWPPASDV